MTPWASRWHRHPGVRSGDELSLGERAADRVRNGMGSWTFVIVFLAFMASWAGLNSLVLRSSSGEDGFDPYPYILLNLMLSMVAGLQGAILLIAAKRADQVSSELALHTFENTEQLQQLVQRNVDLTEAVERLTLEVHRAVAAAAAPRPEGGSDGAGPG